MSLFHGAGGPPRTRRRRVDEEIDVDLFSGGGGASEAIRRATGREPYAAVDHCLHAILMHEVNHPGTLHFHADVAEVRPRVVVGRRRVRLLWASPSCTHFSRARGGGFGAEYKLIGTKSEQVARIGNSVSPYPAAALITANLSAAAREAP